VLAACGEGQPPTAPTPPAGLGGPAFSQTASLKVVNSLADPGDGTCNAAQCTLREAINASGSTEISFASGLTGPITLASPAAGGGTLQVEKTLTITGPGTGIVIRRRSTDPAFRIFRIGSGATVTLANLTIRNGRDDPGGGIVNRGTLELTNCTVSDNSGDGIANFARLTLRHSTVASNTGAGIFNYTDGTLTLRHSAGLPGLARPANGGPHRHGTVERHCRQELHGSDVSCLRRAAEVRSVATAIRRPAQHGEPKAVAVAFRPRRTAHEEPRRLL